MKIDMASNLYGVIADLPEMVWGIIAKVIGAVAGSAISIAYLLPKNRREAVLRFATGMTVGMVFGTAAGLKLVDYLQIGDRMSAFEIALFGAAASSLCAWWGLGVLQNAMRRLMR